MMKDSKAAGRIYLEEITSVAAFEHLRVEWGELWGRDPFATPFQTPEWSLAWWTHLQTGALWVITLRSEERLIGIAPLSISCSNFTGEREVSWIGEGITDYLDVLIEPGFEAEGIDLLLHHIAISRASWDTVRLSGLRKAASLLRALPPRGMIAKCEQSRVCPILRLPETADRFEEGLRPRLRRSLRRGSVMLDAVGSYSFERATIETLPEHLEALFRLHSARWQARHQPGALTNSAVLEFHREVAPQLLQRGCLWLDSVRVRGNIVAVYYGFLHRHRYYYYLSGFDPIWARYNLGTKLMAWICEASIKEGANVFDFLRGNHAYKYLWGAIDEPLYTLLLRYERILHSLSE